MSTSITPAAKRLADSLLRAALDAVPATADELAQLLLIDRAQVDAFYACPGLMPFPTRFAVSALIRNATAPRESLAAAVDDATREAMQEYIALDAQRLELIAVDPHAAVRAVLDLPLMQHPSTDVQALVADLILMPLLAQLESGAADRANRSPPQI